jgi:hypothetical protein
MRFAEASSIRSATDLGCGDWQFSYLINWSNVEYPGIDLVPEVIDNNRAFSYFPHNRNMFWKNAVCLMLPDPSSSKSEASHA